MVDLHQHVPLSFDVRFLLFLLDILFLENFHGVDLLVALALDQDDLGVGALADYGQQGEVVQSNGRAIPRRSH